MARDLGAAPQRLRAGRAHSHTLVSGDFGGAAQRLRAHCAGDRTALARSLQPVDRDVARAHDAVTPVLAPHEDGRAHVLAPFETVLASAPAEHAASVLLS